MTDALLLIQVLAERAWAFRRSARDIAVDAALCMTIVVAFVAIIVCYGAW